MTGRAAAGAGRRVRVALAAAVLAVGALLAACGSNPAQINQADAKAAISRAYATLFDFSNHDVESKVSAIEDGSSLRAALTQALSSSLAERAAGARVSAMQLLSAASCRQSAIASPCAKVTYNLLSPERTPLFATPSIGYAVYAKGRWLVAKSTICGLLSLFYSTSGQPGSPPGC